MSAAPTPPRGLFVSLDLDVGGDPGRYRDAVARLSAATGFSVDPRFEPAFRDRQRVSVWGWLPPEQVGTAMRLPGVARLETERRTSAPAPAVESRAEISLALRVPEGEGRTEALSSALLRLAEAGFSWERTEGYEAATAGKQPFLVVTGRAPIRALSRILADPAVARIAPRLPPPAPLAPSGPRFVVQPVFLLVGALSGFCLAALFRRTSTRRR